MSAWLGGEEEVYSKSPTYGRVQFQECVPKSNLFVSPAKLA